MMRRFIWTGLSVPGKEVLTLDAQPDQYVVRSKVTGGDADLGTIWDLRYTVVCDKNWHVRRVSVSDNQTDNRLVLQTDGKGHWTDAQGDRLPNLDGCLDIDLRATPFSNTLPIRRLNLAIGQSSTLDVVYINAPGLETSRERQRYTKLSETIWKFEQSSASFEATIVVDDDGFVIDYPHLFRRVTT